MISKFYEELRSFNDLDSVINPLNYVEVPNNWSVVITDVINSTEAIETGKYKDVNIAGGLAAMALSNYFGKMEFPFLFGGDGITFLIPNESTEDIKSILNDTKEKVYHFFKLRLRVGIVPYSVLKDSIKKIFIGKWKITDHYNQAILIGDGVEYVEDLVKKVNSEYTITDDYPIKIEANFQGFTCRWKDIPSPNGETINLIVKFLSHKNDRSLYQSVLTNIEMILGEINDYHPLSETNLKVTSSYRALNKEAIASSQQKSGFKKFLALLKIYFETFVTRIVMHFRLPVKAHFYELKNLKKYQVEASDFRKFDGSLKMVLSLTKEKRASLESYLETEERNGILVFGTHISDSALLTCLMHSESSSEVHFVDGSNGGYAMAAKVLKQKFAKMQAS
ncbi:MAG: DUF3095 domain-containing protein [Leptospiraceae bacterium]|nr:DUF3095 domain-containing protein [Leptospiraceae bacterium]MCZ8345027.1 DUF3095 domain-containing protein [Leptospiraceae bacterium]